MKKVLALFTALAVFVSSFATAFVTAPPKHASEIMLPVGKSGLKISLLDLSRISVKDYQTVSGKKMSVADKLGFKLGQRELRKSIHPDGTLDEKRMGKAFKKMAAGDFSIGGFALGFFLFLLGVLIAYIISDDNKAARTKWAWIGALASLLLGVIFIL